MIMVGLGTIIEGKNAVLSVIESGRATSIGYLDNERLSEEIQNILNLAVQNTALSGKTQTGFYRFSNACDKSRIP